MLPISFERENMVPRDKHLQTEVHFFPVIPCKHVVSCQYRAFIGPMLPASDQLETLSSQTIVMLSNGVLTSNTSCLKKCM